MVCLVVSSRGQAEDGGRGSAELGCACDKPALHAGLFIWCRGCTQLSLKWSGPVVPLAWLERLATQVRGCGQRARRWRAGGERGCKGVAVDDLTSEWTYTQMKESVGCCGVLWLEQCVGTSHLQLQLTAAELKLVDTPATPSHVQRIKNPLGDRRPYVHVTVSVRQLSSNQVMLPLCGSSQPPQGCFAAAQQRSNQSEALINQMQVHPVRQQSKREVLDDQQWRLGACVRLQREHEAASAVRTEQDGTGRSPVESHTYTQQYNIERLHAAVG